MLFRSTVSNKSNLGGNGNVTITGGSSGYVLSTDGLGNLSWVAQSGGSGNVRIDSFTGNGVQTAFTLSSTPTSNAYISVNLNGVIQTHGTYSLSGSVLTMSTAPSNGALLEVQTWNMGGGSSLAISNQGSLLTSAASSINFTGSGVTATNVDRKSTRLNSSH